MVVEWTAKASDGTQYTGAEVTSEGFHIFGLPPYNYYSAGIACFMTGNDWMQDNYDVWNNSMDLAGITNKGIVGFKYFGFGGLKKDTKGIKAQQGYCWIQILRLWWFEERHQGYQGFCWYKEG